MGPGAPPAGPSDRSGSLIEEVLRRRASSATLVPKSVTVEGTVLQPTPHGVILGHRLWKPRVEALGLFPGWGGCAHEMATPVLSTEPVGASRASSGSQRSLEESGVVPFHRWGRRGGTWNSVPAAGRSDVALTDAVRVSALPVRAAGLDLPAWPMWSPRACRTRQPPPAWLCGTFC